MKLLRAENEHLRLAVDWLAEPANHKWLDFGAGLQLVTAAHVKLLAGRPQHCIRFFTDDGDERPIGMVCLSDISAFKNANLWYVLGDKSCGGRSYTSRAVREMLRLGFDEQGLHCIAAWAVARNVASVRVLEKNGFKRAGCLREYHVVDGNPEDRLLFDLLASEFEPDRKPQTSKLAALTPLTDLLDFLG